MKKIYSVLAILLMLMLSLNACGKKQSNSMESEDSMEQEIYESESEIKSEETEKFEVDESEVIESEEVESEVVVVPEEDYFWNEYEFITDIDASLQAALDYKVEGEDLEPSAQVSNAILESTSYEITSTGTDYFEIIVKYPDVVNALREEEAKLPEGASEEEMDEMLRNLAKKIAEGEVVMIEKTIEFPIESHEGIWSVVWTEELMGAFTGGIANMQ